MNPKDISTAENPDLRASLAAMQRAAALARKLAIQTDTGIVIAKDGKLVHVSADELRKEAADGICINIFNISKINSEVRGGGRAWNES